MEEKENSNNGLLFASFGKADDDVDEQEGQDRKSLAIDRGGGLIKKSQKGYKTGALKKKTSSKSSAVAKKIDRKKQHTDRDRLFSNDTLNYVVKGIGAVEISPKPNDDDEEQEAEQVPRASRMKQTSSSSSSSSDNYCEEEVFKSSQCEGQQKFEAVLTEVKEIAATTELRPHAHEAAVVPRCINKASRGLVTGLIAGNGTAAAGSDESIDVVNSSLPPPSQLFYQQKQQQPQVITDKTSKADATSAGSNSIYSHPKSSTHAYNNNLLHSPSTSINFGQGNLHASTPISHHKNPSMAFSNYRDGGERPNLFESPRSPLISNVPLPDLISRKGGKNWRRSVNVAKFSPNGGRRFTIASKPATTLKVSISFGSYFEK